MTQIIASRSILRKIFYLPTIINMLNYLTLMRPYFNKVRLASHFVILSSFLSSADIGRIRKLCI